MKDLIELRVLWPGFVARADEEVQEEIMRELLGKKWPPSEVSLSVEMVARSDPWRTFDVIRVKGDLRNFNYPMHMSCKCGHIPAKVLKINGSEGSEGNQYYVEITNAKPPRKMWVTQDQLGHSP